MPENKEEQELEEGQGQSPESDPDKGKEEEIDVASEIKKLKSDFSSVVGELKDVRTQKQEAEAERDALKAQLEDRDEGESPETGSDNVESTVKRVLAQERQTELQHAEEEAKSAFKSKHKEFADDADPAGIKYSAVEEQYKRFNKDGARSQKDYEELMEDALRLVKARQSGGSTTVENPYASDANAKDTKSPDEKDNDLSPKEESLIANMGWTKEKYLEKKNRHPDLVDGLLAS